MSRSTGEQHGWERVWYQENGFVCWEIEYQDGQLIRQAYYYFDGTIIGPRGPWLTGATHQTEPFMPEWMKDGEKWAKALEEQPR